MTAQADAVLEARDVTKRFGDFTALDQVSMQLRRGAIHALLGANGSGKSTLVRLITGVHRPTSGNLMIGGKTSDWSSPAEATIAGVRVVHQEAPLIDSLSVLEAVATFRGFGQRSFSPIRWRDLRNQTRTLLESVDVRVDLNQRCGTLAPADRAGVAMAIALGTASEEGGPVQVLILDEATAAIPDRDAQQHLTRVRAAADGGVAVMMITHRFGELDIADDLTVLRAGKVVHQSSGGASMPSTREMVDLITGPEHGLEQSGTRNAPRPTTTLWAHTPFLDHKSVEARPDVPRLELRGVGNTWVRNLDLTVAPGEIVGFIGLPEDGVTELPQILSGTTPATDGEILVDGHALPRRSNPSTMVDAGLFVVPADRLNDGGIASLNALENLTMPDERTYWHRPSRVRALSEGSFEAFDVRPRDPQRKFGQFSGGNQQKIVLGKWLSLRPSVLVLNDPTQGVDPGARELVFAAMEDAARQGVGILFFSTEPEQLIRVCSRVVHLHQGQVHAELVGDSINESEILTRSYS